MAPEDVASTAKADFAVILGERLTDGSISKKQSDWLTGVVDALLDAYLASP
jgi:hypothetical protein